MDVKFRAKIWMQKRNETEHFEFTQKMILHLLQKQSHSWETNLGT